jgi:hypothetical protein
MARRPSKAKKARKKPAGSRKKRISKPGKMARKAAAKPARKTRAKTAAKTPAKTAAKSARKPAPHPEKMRRRDPDMTVNALIMMVLIMIALGNSLLYLQTPPDGAGMMPVVAAMEKQ